jgi:outer membrane lipoprotein SlyB
MHPAKVRRFPVARDPVVAEDPAADTLPRRAPLARSHSTAHPKFPFQPGETPMKSRWQVLASVAAISTAFFALEAVASTVSYGRITAVRQVNIENQGAQAAGTLVGGALGVASGSGQSRSNRALRGIGGAAVGSRVAGAASGTTGFEYTVLIGNQTTRIVTEQSGLRVGDCVSVERGQWNNIRLAPDERCESARTAPAPEDTGAAAACEAAKQQLLEANSDAEFDRAERRMRLLCGD